MYLMCIPNVSWTSLLLTLEDVPQLYEPHCLNAILRNRTTYKTVVNGSGHKDQSRPSYETEYRAESGFTVLYYYNKKRASCSWWAAAQCTDWRARVPGSRMATRATSSARRQDGQSSLANADTRCFRWGCHRGRAEALTPADMWRRTPDFGPGRCGAGMHA